MRQRTRKFLQRFRRREHCICIAHHALPSEITNLVHHLSRARSSIGQIAAVKNQVRRDPAQVRQHRLKCGPVAVNIGYNGNAQAALKKSLGLICYSKNTAGETLNRWLSRAI